MALDVAIIALLADGGLAGAWSAWRRHLKECQCFALPSKADKAKTHF